MHKDEANRRLLQAAKEGSLDETRAALAVGADIHAMDDVGQTPLHKSAFNGSMVLTRLLIDQGADPNAIDIAGRKPVDWALLNKHPAVAVFLANLNLEKAHTARVTGDRKDKGPPQVGG